MILILLKTLKNIDIIKLFRPISLEIYYFSSILFISSLYTGGLV